MLIKLLYPILNTENINCDSNVTMSADEYSEAIIDNFNQNNHAIDDMLRYGNKNNMIYFTNTQNESYNINDDIKFGECEAYMTILNNETFSLETLLKYVENGKMSIFIVNINPDSVEYDIYTDIKLWINDSVKIHNDNRLSKKEQIDALPIRGLKVKIDDTMFNLETCKIIQSNCSAKSPFNFVILTEKTTLTDNNLKLNIL